MLTLEEYWMGRDRSYPTDLTPEIQLNAKKLLDAVNIVLERAAEDGVRVRGITGGWRPQTVNAATRGAAKNSSHIRAQAVDLGDLQDRSFARWCLSHLDILAENFLWMEDPQWTPTWVHLQRVPPASGARVYRPSMLPPLIGMLPEQAPA